MLCFDCPYGYEDYVRLSENFTDLSQEEIEQSIWCDKVGGKVGYMGCMTELFKNFGLDIDEGRD